MFGFRVRDPKPTTGILTGWGVFKNSWASWRATITLGPRLYTGSAARAHKIPEMKEGAALQRKGFVLLSIQLECWEAVASRNLYEAPRQSPCTLRSCL